MGLQTRSDVIFSFLFLVSDVSDLLSDSRTQIIPVMPVLLQWCLTCLTPLFIYLFIYIVESVIEGKQPYLTQTRLR